MIVASCGSVSRGFFSERSVIGKLEKPNTRNGECALTADEPDRHPPGLRSSDDLLRAGSLAELICRPAMPCRGEGEEGIDVRKLHGSAPKPCGVRAWNSRRTGRGRADRGASSWAVSVRRDTRHLSRGEPIAAFGLEMREGTADLGSPHLACVLHTRLGVDRDHRRVDEVCASSGCVAGKDASGDTHLALVQTTRS